MGVAGQLVRFFITVRQMEPAGTFQGYGGNVASGRNCRTVSRDVIAGRMHSFLNLSAPLENDVNTVLAERTKLTAGGSERRRNVWLCGYDELPGGEE